MIRSLNSLGWKEHNFTKVELLFFEAITVSRSYGEDQNENPLLNSLKKWQHQAYEQTQTPTVRAGQRELAIRRFVLGLKKILASCAPGKEA